MLLPDFSSQREKEKYFHSLNEEQKIDALNEMVSDCEHIVFLGGAGVSTESGIPDFRSKDGLYNKKDKKFGKYKPEYLLSYDCLNKKPAVFFDYFRKNLDCRNILPNDAHKKLSEMDRRGKLDGVITQNIDGLHQKAGSKKVCEIHGSALRSYCVSCRTDYGEDFIFENTEEIPHCPKCGKMVRPDVTLYGEFLPQRDYEEAVALVRYADLLIIGGTSLEVGSAAQLAHMYHGKYLVIINKGKTKLEGKADLVFHESIGKIMNQIEV
ncbi:NAD-dependent deacetylase [Butyrivibrio sp. ob235]|uniref:NAD-dependent protein deacylase n=1 Tax=Butyrivibrio sp. ob235 TaxID=1761780 RepID=UPI0008B2D864|nr:NAD-dependent protein deacylase [Butyrivibrio sp. ob235]SEM14874.1 NAD-dependent deacetylase [Butyrivibrio sp. ob235]